MNAVKTRGTYMCALIECLQSHAVDGITRLTRTELRRHTGISERAIGVQLEKMRGLGAIEMIPGPGVTSAMTYRVLDASLVSTKAAWTVPRVAMMEREYPHRWNPVLTAMLNGLPGTWITVNMVKDWAGKHGLHKTPGLLATRQAPPHRPKAKALRAPKAEAPALSKPKAPKPREREVMKPPPPVVQPERHMIMRPLVSSIVTRLPRIDWHTLPAPSKRAGCQWPLTCEAPATGKFCAAHAGMMGKKTTAGDAHA